MRSPLSYFVAMSVLLGSLVAAGSAQSPMTTPNGAKSDATMIKVRKIDILCQILPLAIRKEQFSPLLASLEHVRARQRALASGEDESLAKLDPAISDALDEALTKGTFPPKELQQRAARLYKTMAIVHQSVIAVIIDDTVVDVKRIFDEGQIKVMANSLDPYLMDPSIKKDSLNQDGKLRFFVQQILLDPLTYDLLVKLSERAG